MNEDAEAGVGLWRSCKVNIRLHQIDALVNGFAFVALAIGLAIGWRRSLALRETITELFMPPGDRSVKSHVQALKPLSLKKIDAHSPEGEVEHILITWEVYVSETEHPSPAASREEDTQTLRRLRELVTA